MLTLSLAASLAAGAATATPLLDGRCEAAEWAGAVRTDLGAGVALLALADAQTLSLCWTLPPNSMGSVDLYIMDAAGRAHNLHMSRQIGERAKMAEGWSAWDWGNHQRWYGPPARWTRSVTRPDGRASIQFAEPEAREMQIKTDRFGRGPWRVMMTVSEIGPERAETVYPPAADPDKPATWTLLRPASAG